MTQPPSSARPASVRLTTTRADTRIYTLEVAAYRSLLVNTFVVSRGPSHAPHYLALVDVGSERPACFDEIRGGLQQIRETYGEPVSLDALDRIVLTHEHPDHVGGLPLVQAHTAAPLAAHALAAESLQDPLGAQQRSLASLQAVGEWAGLPADLQGMWQTMAQRPLIPEGVAVETVLHDGDWLDSVFEVVHLPGHAAGQIGLQVDDVLLSADHLFVGNLPPLYPERLRPLLGLSRYLASLRRLDSLEAADVALVLPSHGAPITQLRVYTAQAREKVRGKLERVLNTVWEQPALTVAQLSAALYPGQAPQRARLLLSQTAALVEYLEEQGLLAEGRRDEAGAATWMVTGADVSAAQLPL